MINDAILNSAPKKKKNIYIHSYINNVCQIKN